MSGCRDASRMYASDASLFVNTAGIRRLRKRRRAPITYCTRRTGGSVSGVKYVEARGAIRVLRKGWVVLRLRTFDVTRECHMQTLIRECERQPAC